MIADCAGRSAHPAHVIISSINARIVRARLRASMAQSLSGLSVNDLNAAALCAGFFSARIRGSLCRKQRLHLLFSIGGALLRRVALVPNHDESAEKKTRHNDGRRPAKKGGGEPAHALPARTSR